MDLNLDTNTLVKYGIAIVAVVIGWALGSLAARTIRKKKTKILANKHYLNLIAVITQVGIVILTSIFVLDYLDLGATAASLAAGAGVAGIIIGYGAQQIFKEATAAGILLFKNHFRIGDWVKIGDYTGKVTSLGFKGVAMITTKNESLFLPATLVISKPIVNYSRTTISTSDKEYWQTVEVDISPKYREKLKQYALDTLAKYDEVSSASVTLGNITIRKSYQVITLNISYKAAFDWNLNQEISDKIHEYSASLLEKSSKQ